MVLTLHTVTFGDSKANVFSALWRAKDERNRAKELEVMTKDVQPGSSFVVAVALQRASQCTEALVVDISGQ